MSTDAARTKLRELIATKQQWLRQWQAPELLSPGRSDMVHILSDNIAELQEILVLVELDKAEPQEPDSPERRCGGPGCDGACCQPVQEPVAFSVGRTLHWHEGKGVSDAQLFAVPPQRPAEPVQEVKGCAHCNHPLYAAIKCRVCGRAHKIGGEE